MKVLHFRSIFLGYSETFIRRIIVNQNQFEPIGMCTDKRKFTDTLPVYEKPAKGLAGVINTIYFHLNWCLPFYNETIQKVRPDIIHAHFGFDGYRMIQPALQNNIPFITSFYGSDVSRLPAEFDWPRRYRKLIKSCNAFVAISEHMKHKLIELGFPEEKIMIIPFGLNLHHYTYSDKIPRERSVMMVGRLVEKKGFIYGLKAIKLLSDQELNITLDIYGNGPLDNKLKKVTNRLGINNRVTFHGYISNDEVLDALKEHQVLVAPSVTASDGDQEGLPNTILEAMAAGTPVVASDHAAIDEVIRPGKTGLLTPERNTEAIADAIRTILNEVEQTEMMKKNARQLIEEKHNITNTVEQIEKLYDKVILWHSKK